MLEILVGANKVDEYIEKWKGKKVEWDQWDLDIEYIKIFIQEMWW